MLISHGGTGSTYQAIQAGISVICYPNHTNHLILANLIEKLGLGLCIDKSGDMDKLRGLDIFKLKAAVKETNRQTLNDNAADQVASSLSSLLF